VKAFRASRRKFSSCWVEVFLASISRLLQLLGGSYPSFWVKASPSSECSSFTTFWLKAFLVSERKLFQFLVEVFQLLSGSFLKLCVEAFPATGRKFLLLSSRSINLRMLMSLLFVLPTSSLPRTDSVSTGPQSVRLNFKTKTTTWYWTKNKNPLFKVIIIKISFVTTTPLAFYYLYFYFLSASFSSFWVEAFQLLIRSFSSF